MGRCSYGRDRVDARGLNKYERTQTPSQVFVYAFVVETRRKTLTEVQALFGASGCDVPGETDGLLDPLTSSAA